MIFLSYRRHDDAGFAHALYQWLARKFPKDHLFMDVHVSIEPGTDFVRLVSAHIAACDILLAVIGPRWRTLARTASADDFVSLEISSAFQLGKRVIPVLVGGADMPKADELPASIRQLARLQAVSIRPDSFCWDTSNLIAWFADLRSEKPPPSDEKDPPRAPPGSSMERATRSSRPPAQTRRYPLWRRWGRLLKAWEVAAATKESHDVHVRPKDRSPRASQ